MKFTCTKENLSRALGIVGGVAQKHVNLPILLNILFQVRESQVELISTNLEIAVKTSFRAKTEREGGFTIPAKTLSDYVNLLTEEQIEMELQGNEMLITCGSSNTKIKGSSPEEYPVIPDIEEQHGYSLAVEPFKKALSQVAIATAKNEIRPELSGVYFSFFSERYSGLVLAATDSYRLAEKKISVAQGQDVFECIVPFRTVHEIGRLLSGAAGSEVESVVRVWVSENQVAVRYGEFEMSSRVVSGKYPDYTQIIPDNFNTTATLSADGLIKKIKAASLFTSVGVNAVSFDLNVSNNTVGISSTSTQTGEHSSEVDVEIVGEENSILLNHRYVLDGLQQITTERVEFCVNTGDAPCLFRPKGKEDYLYVVMPIRQ